MIELRPHIKSYKGRRVNRHADVEVYRNLNKEGVWYSVRQNGRVVGHTQFLILMDVKCVVQEAGRKRALKTGVRNVHAYLAGKPYYERSYYREGAPLRMRYVCGYNPRWGFWVDYTHQEAGGVVFSLRLGMSAAECVLLSKDGVSTSEPTTHTLGQRL